MPLDPGLPPLDVLRNAVKSAFAERRELDEVRIDGTLTQAWQAYTHLLGIGEHELARRLAPIYGIAPQPTSRMPNRARWPWCPSPSARPT